MDNHSHVVDIQRKFYTMATVDNNSAVITMYGDIVEQQPTDWYGNPIEGQYIIESEFLEDLKQVEKCSDITIRMDSCGGDVGVSILIHNRLRELSNAGKKITCIVDGVAMSGGSLIMCACDTVKVNPSSVIMIHKCWCFLFGGYNADELRGIAKQNDAFDKSQISVYKRKTGLTDTVISHMMSDATYMTGKEALEKGFADEFMEDAEPLDIAASADGRSLFVKGRQIHLTSGMFAPDHIPTVNPAARTAAETNIHTMPKTTANEGGTNMENENQNPAVAQPQTEDVSAATLAAVIAEQNRIREIDAIAGLFDSQLVAEAKYGDNTCTAQELAYRAAQKAAQNGNAFMAQLADDANQSNASEVGAAPAADPAEPSEEQTRREVKETVQTLLGKKEG